MSHQKAFDSDVDSKALYGEDKLSAPTHLENNSEDNSLNAGNVGHTFMSPEEKQAALAAAQLADPGLKAFSWRGFVFFLYVVCGGRHWRCCAMCRSFQYLSDIACRMHLWRRQWCVRPYGASGFKLTVLECFAGFDGSVVSAFGSIAPQSYASESLSTIMSSVNSMTQYQRYFGLSAAGASTGLVFGIYTVGGVW